MVITKVNVVYSLSDISDMLVDILKMGQLSSEIYFFLNKMISERRIMIYPTPERIKKSIEKIKCRLFKEKSTWSQGNNTNLWADQALSDQREELTQLNQVSLKQPIEGIYLGKTAKSELG